MTVLQRFSEWWVSDDNRANQLPVTTQAQASDYIKAAFLAGAASVKATDFGINALKRAIVGKENATAMDNIPPM